MRGTNLSSLHARGAAQIAFDVCDLLLDSRRNAELIGIAGVKQVIRQSRLATTGLELVDLTSVRRYLFERDLMVRLRKAVDPKDISFTGMNLLEPTKDSMSGAAAHSAVARRQAQIHLTAQFGTSTLSVLLRFRNDQVKSETVTLAATALRLRGGIQTIADRITFDPSSIELPASGESSTRVVFRLDSEFHVGCVYEAEIIVQTEYRKTIPVVITIESDIPAQ